MANSVKVEGLDEVRRKFAKLADGKVIRDTLTEYAVLVQGDVKPYPPTSAANRPPEPYYQRGVGTVTKSGVRHTSYNGGIRKNWYVKSTPKQVVLGNEAPYSGWVQGVDQAWYHAARRWKVAKTQAEKMLGKLENLFKANVEKRWRAG